MLGSCSIDTAKLRVFLGEHYRSVIQSTCEEALEDSFKKFQFKIGKRNWTRDDLHDRS